MSAPDGDGLVSASLAFSTVVADMLGEMGVTHATYTDEEILSLERACIDGGFWQAWDEFLSWVMFGDDVRERTLAELRAGRGAWRST